MTSERGHLESCALVIFSSCQVAGSFIGGIKGQAPSAAASVKSATDGSTGPIGNWPYQLPQVFCTCLLIVTACPSPLPHATHVSDATHRPPSVDRNGSSQMSCVLTATVHPSNIARTNSSKLRPDPLDYLSCLQVQTDNNLRLVSVHPCFERVKRDLTRHLVDGRYYLCHCLCMPCLSTPAAPPNHMRNYCTIWVRPQRRKWLTMPAIGYLNLCSATNLMANARLSQYGL